METNVSYDCGLRAISEITYHPSTEATAEMLLQLPIIVGGGQGTSTKTGLEVATRRLFDSVAGSNDDISGLTVVTDPTGGRESNIGRLDVVDPGSMVNENSEKVSGMNENSGISTVNLTYAWKVEVIYCRMQCS